MVNDEIQRTQAMMCHNDRGMIIDVLGQMLLDKAAEWKVIAPNPTGQEFAIDTTGRQLFMNCTYANGTAPNLIITQAIAKAAPTLAWKAKTTAWAMLCERFLCIVLGMKPRGAPDSWKKPTPGPDCGDPC